MFTCSYGNGLRNVYTTTDRVTRARRRLTLTTSLSIWTQAWRRNRRHFTWKLSSAPLEVWSLNFVEVHWGKFSRCNNNLSANLYANQCTANFNAYSADVVNSSFKTFGIVSAKRDLTWKLYFSRKKIKVDAREIEWYVRLIKNSGHWRTVQFFNKL